MERRADRLAGRCSKITYLRHEDRCLWRVRQLANADDHGDVMAINAAKQLATFVGKFSPTDQRLIRAIRRALRTRFPTANELVYDNYNFFVIGYCPTERPSDAIISMAARANGVGLCFIQGAKLPDPHNLLQGSGSQTRFIRLESPQVLDRPEVKNLLAAAVAQSKTPFPAAGRGKLIIRSVSTKQRPRKRPLPGQRRGR
jgi:Domain of unknown function (DU1801)